MNASKAPSPSTINEGEIEKFSALAAQWWDPHGPMAPLHRLGPARMGYIRDAACAHFGRDTGQLRPLKGLTALDVGCGAGIVTESLARMGATATGLDASTDAVAAGRVHAEESGLAIDYRAGTAESLAEEGRRFDLITALEVVEHVADVDLFLGALSRLLAPGGLLVFSTPNRTPQSYLSVIVAAERVLHWVPEGTHDWKAFITPEELTCKLAQAGLHVTDLKGLSYSLVNRTFSVTRDTSINYIGTAVAKP
ncbi:bifunctional 2-polyprenyl-6-hydroxyphenol methylase/3-demethylubiquinol 3-O-methyltransferase UbiG [Pedomonas mirosovicensis]|uniref:bifunctional 2-polyprenyl-6-hydroxyphenol methylase/3-demethylubiquinol 3-O-methyltransferase UbiG n=1 Tax=Pedomonas mirosovicensis TaxID=2908641 RepID=UPI0021681DEB|nr:bifunctional 2-polyprenyl-6-hydroxyphenol methylase/3-demethylubiquinol 3-O-methyltransferase UbiG [Pedomonas mirosovicensis]